MKDPLQPKRCARKLAALAAPDRLQIVRFLQNGPRNVSEISEALKTTVVNTSHHLAVLRNAGIVKSERQGRFMIYSLRPVIFQPSDECNTTEHLDLGCCRLEIPRTED